MTEVCLPGTKINRFGVSKMALMVHVYHLLFAGCLVDSDHTVITLSDPDTPPTIATLEGAYDNTEANIFIIYMLCCICD